MKMIKFMKTNTKAVDLTTGNEMKSILLFALPLIVGNLFQQLYNLVDTIIVGKFIGADALAAVGSSYMTMNFLTSIVIGLCMGSGIVISYFYGSKAEEKLEQSLFQSFVFIMAVTLVINGLSLLYIEKILKLLNIEQSIFAMTKEYLFIIIAGMGFVFLYNYFASVLRSIGNSFIPLVFLAIASIINIILDYLFVVPLGAGVAGAASATVIAQAVSAVGMMIYTICKVPEVKISRRMLHGDRTLFQMIVNQSVLTSLQQSIMNFGILMVQGLVNSFGVIVMAGFAAAVKIDSFAYMPVQDFGNAFSTYVAQNRGAKKMERIDSGCKSAIKLIVISCAIISTLVVVFAKQLMFCFVNASETQVVAEGVRYLRIVAPFYCLIGFLFLLYGLYRGLGKPQMSIVLTILSLGTRVVLAYTLSDIATIGIVGIWWAIPIGWFLADMTGFLYYRYLQKRKHQKGKKGI